MPEISCLPDRVIAKKAGPVYAEQFGYYYIQVKKNHILRHGKREQANRDRAHPDIGRA
jgi:hypothetical protein